MNGRLPIPNAIKIYRIGAHKTSVFAKISFSLLAFLAVGYWSVGKSFGYLGYYPILISEISIVVLTVLLLLIPKRYRVHHISYKLSLILIGIIITQAIYSSYALDQSFVEIIRSIAPFYYCFFAFATFNAIRSIHNSPSMRFALSPRTIDTASFLILTTLTLSFVTNTYFLDQIPVLPQANIPILYYKATDAFMPISVLLFLWSRSIIWNLNGIWALGIALIGSARSRTALVSLAFVMLLVFRPKPKSLIPIGFLLSCAIVMISLDVKVNMGYREISARQYTANILSFISPSDAAEMDFNAYQNSEWRRKWWMSILQDSISDGYILIGRGWGTNLALDYGIVNSHEAYSNTTVLRNPHNMFFSTLGRGGWVVALLWLFLNLSLLWSLVKVWRASKQKAPDLYLISQACVVYLSASLLQANSDVFLESPQNAIPHWIVFGIGWYACEEWTRAVALESRISTLFSTHSNLLSTVSKHES